MEGNIARMAAVFLIGFGLMSGSLRAHEDSAYTHSALGLFTPRTTCLFSLCTLSFEGTNTVTRDTLNAISAHLPANQWSSSVTRTVGIVMADFPGDSLIGAIIENNVILRAIE